MPRSDLMLQWNRDTDSRGSPESYKDAASEGDDRTQIR